MDSWYSLLGSRRGAWARAFALAFAPASSPAFPFLSGSLAASVEVLVWPRAVPSVTGMAQASIAAQRAQAGGIRWDRLSMRPGSLAAVRPRAIAQDAGPVAADRLVVDVVSIS